MMYIDVIIADDHAVVRDGIKAVVERKSRDIRIVGEAGNGEELLKLAGNTRADVFVLDVTMPNLNGIDACARLLRDFPDSSVIILSMHDSRSFVEKAIKAGAKGYILKENATEEIVDAIREVRLGRYYMSPKISKYIVQGFLGTGRSLDGTRILTQREKEVLQLVAEGYTTKEIAKKLFISPNTVNVHKKNIMEKLDIHKQADLVRFAIKEGIVQV